MATCEASLPRVPPPCRSYPAIIYQLSLFYPPRRLGVAFTYVTTATAAAGLLGAPMAAGLLSLDGLGGLSGWRLLFLFEALPTLALAAALPFLLPAGPLEAGFLSRAEQRYLWKQCHGEADVELAASPSAAAAAEAGPADGTWAPAPEPAGPPSDSSSERGKAAAAAAGEQLPLLLPASEPGSPADPAAGGGQGSHDGGTSSGLSRAAFREGLLDRRIWHLAACMLLIDVVMNAA